jgi:PAS domain S-box-containing protein
MAQGPERVSGRAASWRAVTPAALPLVAAAAAAPFAGVWLWRRQAELKRDAGMREQAVRRLAGVEATGDELVWEMDADGVMLYLAPVVHDYLGYDAAELEGRHVDVLLPGRDQARAAELLSRSSAQGTGWTEERYTFLGRDGREVPIVSSGIVHVGSGGRVTGFTGTVRRADSGAAARRRLQRKRDRIARVVDQRLLRTVFQPVIDVVTGAVIGAEALTRFTADPSAAPDLWFADAAEVGLGTELELLAVETALEAARLLPPDLQLAVNLSPTTLRCDRLPELLQGSGWPPDRVVIEVTEHVRVEDYGSLAICIDALRARGVQLAVDDAGAGYASFRHILGLRPDFIKLDRALIGGLDTDPARRALVAAVVTFGREVGAQVIAEGVETPAELRAVRQLGVGAAQGYCVGRPAAAAAGWGPSR